MEFQSLNYDLKSILLAIKIMIPYFVAIDNLTQKSLEVIVYNPTAITPTKGEIAMGKLIP
jgi:hypothetical protein